jgi:hypothetical protein
VSSILVLVGLLVLSYAGSFLARTLGGAGLPSSVEYVALGLLLGPHVGGIVGHELVTTFEPLAQVALGWLAFVIGLDFGRTEKWRAGPAGMTLGLLSGAITGTAVAAAVWFYTTRLRHAPADLDHVLLAGGIGVTGAETTRHAIRWVAERYGAAGKLTKLLSDFAHADDLVPLIATAFLFALAPVPLTRVVLVPWAWVGVTVGFGVVLGAMTALHIGRELRVDQTWGVLLGMSVLGLGIAARLGMSVLTVLFFMGFTTAALSRHRAALRAMVAPIERPIVLPALVLAGAHVDFHAMPGLAGIIAVAVGARFVTKMIFGAAIALPYRASPLLGVGLLPTGSLSVGLGLAFAIRFPGPVGEAVLAAAFVACLVGDLAGPLVLRRVLVGAGEIDVRATAFDGIAAEAPSDPGEEPIR